MTAFYLKLLFLVWFGLSVPIAWRCAKPAMQTSQGLFLWCQIANRTIACAGGLLFAMLAVFCLVYLTMTEDVSDWHVLAAVRGMTWSAGAVGLAVVPLLLERMTARPRLGSGGDALVRLLEVAIDPTLGLGAGQSASRLVLLRVMYDLYGMLPNRSDDEVVQAYAARVSQNEPDSSLSWMARQDNGVTTFDLRVGAAVTATYEGMTTGPIRLRVVLPTSQLRDYLSVVTVWRNLLQDDADVQLIDEEEKQ